MAMPIFQAGETFLLTNAGAQILIPSPTASQWYVGLSVLDTQVIPTEYRSFYMPGSQDWWELGGGVLWQVPNWLRVANQPHSNGWLAVGIVPLYLGRNGRLLRFNVTQYN